MTDTTKDDTWTVAGRTFSSRLIVGTGKYATYQQNAEAAEAAGAEIVTVAVRRVNLNDPSQPMLVDYIAKEVCERGLEKLQVARQPAKVRNAIYTYITKVGLDDKEIDAVECGEFWMETTRAPILLLRGILAGGVLVFALSQKRWRVNYGLASRTPTTRLAVPYRAKDSPSLRSEFSHPDVVILLTSLCYYYQGLDDQDLFTALAHLVDSDQADIEYQSWVKDALNLPSAFRQL